LVVSIKFSLPNLYVKVRVKESGGEDERITRVPHPERDPLAWSREYVEGR